MQKYHGVAPQLKMGEIKEGRKVVRIRFDFTPDKINSGVDLRTGEITTRHKKPRKPRKVTYKPEQQENIPDVHKDQQSLL